VRSYSPQFLVENFLDPGAFFRPVFVFAHPIDKDLDILAAEPPVAFWIDAVRLENALLLPAPDGINMNAQEPGDFTRSEQCFMVNRFLQCD
jgi:hypothetical protein